MRTLFLFLSLCFAVNARASAPTSWSVLWVLDNSGSMRALGDKLIKSLPVLVQRLKAKGVVDFRMAVTTTDVISHEGKLIADPNGLKVVRASDSDQALAEIVKAVADSPTSFWEQGLEAAYLAIQNEGGAFLKDGEPLAVVIVSDEDDYSCEKDCFGVEPEHNKNWTPYPLDRYKELFKGLKDKRGIDTLLFPIVGILEGSCDFNSYGVRYLKVLSQVGGLSGSVCGADFVNSLFAVADRIGKFSPPPTVPIVLVNPVQLPEARENQAYTADLSPFVQGSGLLTFSKMSGPSWISSGADGTVRGVPGRTDLGINQFVAKVCNENGHCTLFNVNLSVTSQNHLPVWQANPIPLSSARLNQTFQVDLSPFLSDSDGDPLQCRAISLPSWLVLSPSCVLSGTPRAADVGKFSMAIQASDGKVTVMGFAAGRVVAR